MTTAEVLESARYLIHIPEWWTQGAAGRDKQGTRCHPLSPSVYTRCMAGALYSLYRDEGGSVVTADGILQEVVGDYTFFNDTHTHAEVLQKMDQAIGIAKERGL